MNAARCWKVWTYRFALKLFVLTACPPFFDSANPRPVSTSALDTAAGKYAYAAYVGSQTNLKTCAELYSTCKYNSKVILSLVRIARESRN